MIREMLVRELAEALATTFEGDGEKRLRGVADIEGAGSDELSFAANRKALEKAHLSSAGCLIVPLEFPNPSGRTLIRAANPRGTFAFAVSLLYPRRPIQPGIHPTAVVSATAAVDPSAEVGPHCTIGDRVRVGAATVIGPGCSIGAGSLLGRGCLLHARVTLYHDVSLGDRAILHSGCVLGADGFGFVLEGGQYQKFPQVGRVLLGDDVEIGANSTVDRAAVGVTSIGNGTKLDNMVHIGHNCRIGRHVVIAAQTGLSGGVVVEDYAVIGGQVGIGDKARIESRAVLGSGSGVLTSKIVHGGQVLWGTPARPLREYLEQLASLGRLPELRKEVEALRKRVDELES
jgi:UDP-3-O-[3-hydroxymyristoyl] glucosamine N-acyltransferase